MEVLPKRAAFVKALAALKVEASISAELEDGDLLPWTVQRRRRTSQNNNQLAIAAVQRPRAPPRRQLYLPPPPPVVGNPNHMQVAQIQPEQRPPAAADLPLALPPPEVVGNPNHMQVARIEPEQRPPAAADLPLALPPPEVVGNPNQMQVALIQPEQRPPVAADLPLALPPPEVDRNPNHMQVARIQPMQRSRAAADLPLALPPPPVVGNPNHIQVTRIEPVPSDLALVAPPRVVGNPGRELARKAQEMELSTLPPRKRVLREIFADLQSKQYVCKICTSSFNRARSLSAHIAHHTRKKNKVLRKMDKDGASTSTAGSDNQPPSRSDQRVQCGGCGRNFPSRRSLGGHRHHCKGRPQPDNMIDLNQAKILALPW